MSPYSGRRQRGAWLCRIVAACGLAIGATALPTFAAGSGVCALDVVFSEGFDVPATLDLTAPGPFTVASVTGSSTQNARVTPWVASYPIGASAAAIVVFAPNLQLPSSYYDGWTQHLASWGYVAVRADPPSSLFSIDEPAMALDLRNIITDLLKPAALPVTVDSSRIATSGHGLGGKVALLAAAGDARIKAVFTFDPLNDSGPGGYTTTQPNIVPQPMGNLALPIGILGETLDAATNQGQACAPAAINYQTLFSAATAAPAAYEWTLAGASFMSFVPDKSTCGFACGFCNTPTLADADAYAFMRSSAVAFLQTHLAGAPRLCPWLSGKQLPSFISVRESPLP